MTDERTSKPTTNPFPELSDADLNAEWDKVEDGENLTRHQQAVIDEIERRNLDL